MSDNEQAESKKKQVLSQYPKTQIKIAKFFYIWLVVAIIITILGFLWFGGEVLFGQGLVFDWFMALQLGWQIAVVGALLAGLFFLLVYFFGLFKKGENAIFNLTFKIKQVDDQYKNRREIQVIVFGLLLSLIGIMFGVVYGLITEILSAFSAGASSTLAAFSPGELCLIGGILLLVLDGLCMFMIFFIKNGYYSILRLIGKIEK
jgi:hypothetical protein